MSLKRESLKGRDNQIQCKNSTNKSHKLVFKRIYGGVRVILGHCSELLLHNPVVVVVSSSVPPTPEFLGPSLS